MSIPTAAEPDLTAHRTISPAHPLPSEPSRCPPE